MVCKIMGDNQIRAVFNEDTIRVYQAYGHQIANEVEKLGTFGESFKRTRMTWIKPSFLWMMYRCGWGSKSGQERVFAIDIKRSGFDFILNNAVLASYDKSIYGTKDNWKEALENSSIRCQWDPERDIHGNPMGFRSLQIGIKDTMVHKYLNEWIVNMTDITDEVLKIKNCIDSGQEYEYLLPVEEIYEPIYQNELDFSFEQI